MDPENKTRITLINHHELVTEFRQKIIEAELLSEKLKDLEWESDIFLNLMKCSAPEEMHSLLEEFFPQAKATETPPNSSVEKLLGYKLLGISARKTNDNDIFVEYLPFHEHNSSLMCMLLKPAENGNFELKDFNLPHNTPVDELQKYLSSDVNDVITFISALHRYVWAFWIRESYVNQCKGFLFLNKYQIYFNRSKTMITFQLELVNEVKVEVCLRFKALSILPFSISFIEISDAKISEDHKIALGELKQALMNFPFPEVLKNNFEGIEDRAKNNESDNSSKESTIVFDLFNTDD